MFWLHMYMHNGLSLLGTTLKYSLVPSPSGVWKCSTEMNNSSSNRIKWAQLINNNHMKVEFCYNITGLQCAVKYYTLVQCLSN